MSGGGGFIADMIARIKANEAVKNEILKRRAKYIYYKASSALQPDRREVTQVRVEAIRQKIREESRHERIRSLWALFITIVLLIGLYFGLQLAFGEYRKLQQYRNQEKINTEQEHIDTFGPR